MVPSAGGGLENTTGQISRSSYKRGNVYVMPLSFFRHFPASDYIKNNIYDISGYSISFEIGMMSIKNN